MIKLNKYLFLCLFLVLCAPGYIAFANETLTKPRVIYSKSEILEYISGKTLWHKKTRDRFYFSKDGEFIQQFLGDNKEYNQGSILEGRYFVSPDNKLCWKYNDDTISTKPFCFQVVIGGNILKSWGEFDDPVQLYSRGYNQDTKPDFYWNRWNYSNLLFEPEYANDLFLKTQKMSQLIKENISSDENIAIDRYASEIKGKIMILPLGAVYHDKQNNAVFIDRSSVDMILNAPDESKEDMINKSTILEAKSYFIGDIHCWVFKNRENSCQVIDLNGRKSLLKPQDGYVHHMNDGFTRVIKSNDLIEIH